MKKGKRAPVRAKRKPPRPRRGGQGDRKVAPSRAVKGGGSPATPQYVYFVPEHDPEHRASGKRGITEKGKGSHSSRNAVGTRKRPRAPVEVQYYEPPPPPRAMVTWTDAEVRTWLDSQHPAYVETVSESAERNGIPIEAMVRRQARTPCPECGNDGSPTTFHRWNCPIAPEILRAPPPRSFKKVEIAPPLEEDDDLPF